MNALAIIEAETPKKAIQAVAALNLDGTSKALERSGWSRAGSLPHSWQIVVRYSRDGFTICHGFRQGHPALQQPGVSVYNIWWDGEEREWVFKFENVKRTGNNYQGFQTFKDGKAMLRIVGENYPGLIR